MGGSSSLVPDCRPRCSLASSDLQEVQCEYSACNLGVQSAGTSATALRAVGGIIPVPLTAPEPVLSHHQQAAADAPSSAPASGSNGWFHPLLGASSNHAAGFQPRLDDHLGKPVSATRQAAAGGAAAGGAAIIGTSHGDIPEDGHYIRNLRYTLDRLQWHLASNPAPEPLMASGPSTLLDGDVIDVSGGGEADRGNSGTEEAGTAASVVIYIVSPTDQQPGLTSRLLLEAACRLAPLSPRPSHQQASQQAQKASHGGEQSGVSSRRDAPVVGALPLKRTAAADVTVPMTPAMADGDVATLITQRAEAGTKRPSDPHHHQRQRPGDAGAIYSGAADDNFVQIVPPGCIGEAAGAGRSPCVTLAHPPGLSDIGPRAKVDITLQPLELSSLRDVTGGAARATALSIYAKIRRTTSMHAKCGTAPLDVKQPDGEMVTADAPAASVNADAPAASVAAGRIGQALDLLASSSRCGSHALYEPPAIISPLCPDDGLNGERALTLHCSYAWSLNTSSNITDRSSMGSSLDSSSFVTWLALAWTDARGELMEIKAEALSCECQGSEAIGQKRHRDRPGLGTQLGAVAAKLSSRVLSDSLALYDKLRECSAASGCAPSVAFDGGGRVVVTKSGPMTAEERSAWDQTLKALDRKRRGGAGGPSVQVMSLDEVKRTHLDRSVMGLPQGGFVVAAPPNHHPVRVAHSTPDGGRSTVFRTFDVMLFPPPAVFAPRNLLSRGVSDSPSSSRGSEPLLPVVVANGAPLTLHSLRFSVIDGCWETHGSDRQMGNDDMRIAFSRGRSLASELLNLSSLHMALFSVGRVGQRAVAESSGNAVATSTSQTEPLLVPLHCSVADALLSLCLSSDGVVGTLLNSNY